MYDFALVDTQLFLTNTFHAIKYQYELEELPYEIVTTVLRSFINLTKELRFHKIALLHDTWPYYKTEILTGAYKDSRSYTTQEDVDEIEDEEEKKKAQYEADLLKKRGIAKRILKTLDCIGLPSFYKSGYEADDLAYLFSRYASEEGKSVVLVSWDSDWQYLVNDNVDVFSKFKGLVTKDTKLSETDLFFDNQDLFEYKRLYDSLYGSHNDFRCVVTDEAYDLPVKEFYKLYSDPKIRPSLFKDYNLFLNQYDASNILEYPEIEKTKGMYYYLDKIGHIPSQGQFDKWANKNYVKVNSTSYSKLISCMDPKYYFD